MTTDHDKAMGNHRYQGLEGPQQAEQILVRLHQSDKHQVGREGRISSCAAPGPSRIDAQVGDTRPLRRNPGQAHGFVAGEFGHADHPARALTDGSQPESDRKAFVPLRPRAGIGQWQQVVERHNQRRPRQERNVEMG